MQTNTVYSLFDTSIGYNKGQQSELVIQEKINFKLRKGELTTLIGANGIGKSTLLKTLTCNIKPISGSIILNGKPIETYRKKDLAKMISLVLTEKTYAGGLKVNEVVALGRMPYTGFWGTLDQHDQTIVQESMMQAGISHKKENYFSELSDGEKQKVMIAKALAQQTPVIILDEPTSFLDITSRIEIMSLLSQLAHNQNKAILLSTHDIEQALLCSDQMWLFHSNGNSFAGTPEDLMAKGYFDNLFNHAQIRFNPTTGQYNKVLVNQIMISYSNQGSYPDQWFDNLFLRYGYKKSVQPESHTLHIDILENNQMILHQEGRSESLESFADLAKKLRAIKGKLQ